MGSEICRNMHHKRFATAIRIDQDRTQRELFDWKHGAGGSRDLTRLRNVAEKSLAVASRGNNTAEAAQVDYCPTVEDRLREKGVAVDQD